MGARGPPRPDSDIDVLYTLRPGRKLGWEIEQLADELGVAQQVVASYEIGRRRVPVSTLPALARVLGVSIEGLIGEDEKPARRGPSPKLQRHLERISALPKPQQRAVMEVLEAVLAQSSR